MRAEQSKRKKHGVRRKRKPSKFAYFLLLLVLGSCATAVAAAIFLKAETVEIIGESPYSQNQIKAVCGITKDTNLLMIDRKKTAEKLCAALPYISDAKVTISLPTKVIIKVVKDTPKYYFKFGDRYALADANLKALELTKEIGGYKSLININGADVSQFEPGLHLKFRDANQEGYIKTLSDGIKEAKLQKITDYIIGDSYQLSVVYDGRVKIIIGTQSDVSKKLTVAADIIKTKILQTDKGTLDVSTENKRYTFSPN